MAFEGFFPDTMVNPWLLKRVAFGSMLPQKRGLTCTGLSPLAARLSTSELQRDGRSIMFLIRTAFWLALILLILPIDREEAGIANGPGTFETFAAVQTVVSDMRGFCDRNPNACATGAATVDVLRKKAVYSAGVVQGWLADDDQGATLQVRAEDDMSAPLPQSDVSRDDVAALIMAADGRIPASEHPPL